MLQPDRVDDIETTVGLARAHVHRVRKGVPRGTLVLGHGAGGGVDAWDLQSLAQDLPSHGIEVILLEQPWAVAGAKVAASQPKVDAAFRESVTWLRRSGEALRRLVVGGRSTGARIACRTAADVDADAVLCLAFPLHPPGKPEKDRGDELAAAAVGMPVTVIQGDRDPFGGPVEIAAAAQGRDVHALVVAVPWADHSLRVGKKAPLTLDEVALVLSETARRAVLHRFGNDGPLLAR